MGLEGVEDRSPTGNWNVAQPFSYNILFEEHLQKIKQYQVIAKFGVANFEDQYQLSSEMKIHARIDGMIWYNNTLASLLTWSIFACKKKPHKEDLKKYQEQVKKLEKNMTLISEQIVKRDRKVTTINEQRFMDFLSMHNQIFEDVLLILNKNDLIFSNIDFDMEEYQKQVEDEIINQG